MTTYNDIGIDSKLDWERIQKLLRIGLIAGIIFYMIFFLVLCGTQISAFVKGMNDKISISGVPETMLQTMYARAHSLLQSLQTVLMCRNGLLCLTPLYF